MFNSHQKRMVTNTSSMIRRCNKTSPFRPVEFHSQRSTCEIRWAGSISTYVVSPWRHCFFSCLFLKKGWKAPKVLEKLKSKKTKLLILMSWLLKSRITQHNSNLSNYFGLNLVNRVCMRVCVRVCVVQDFLQGLVNLKFSVILCTEILAEWSKRHKYMPVLQFMIFTCIDMYIFIPISTKR